MAPLDAIWPLLADMIPRMPTTQADIVDHGNNPPPPPHPNCGEPGQTG